MDIQNQSPLPILATKDLSWIESLALEELNMEESGVINLHTHLDPIFLLEEASIKFMNAIRDQFELLVDRFNTFRGGKNGTGLIKIFKISNTVNDFMLYRNSVKLIVSRKASDLIHIAFQSNTGSMQAAKISLLEQTPAEFHEIKAHLGAFNNITWRFEGEIVDNRTLCKHYLTEFLRHTAR